MKKLADTRIPAPGARTTEVDENHVPASFGLVRIFPCSPGRVALQIRTKGVTTNHGRKTRLCFSHAVLGLTEALALRKALDVWISDWSLSQVQEATPAAFAMVKRED